MVLFIIYIQMEKLWLKIPENGREILKEVWRWVTVALDSIVLELLTDATFMSRLNNLSAKTVLSIVLKAVVLRFLDRVIYLANGSKANTATKVLTLSK